MKTVAKVLFGSHLYGTSTPESDLDYKEIFVPSGHSIVTCQVTEHFNMNTNTGSSKNTSSDIDHELYSLKYFLSLAARGETVALDLIHAPNEMVVHSDLPETWDFIRKHRSKFYTTDMKAYLGYVRKQAAKYGIKGSRLACLKRVLDIITPYTSSNFSEQVKVGNIKHLLPKLEFALFTSQTDDKGTTQIFYEVLGRKYQMTITVDEMYKSLYKLWEEYGDRARKAEENQGIDWKALSHAYRAGVQLAEIYDTGDLVMPLQMAGQIKDIKAGKIDFKLVQENLESIVDDVEKKAKIAAKNGLPKKVDKEFWDKFIHDVYLQEVKSYYRFKE